MPDSFQRPAKEHMLTRKRMMNALNESFSDATMRGSALLYARLPRDPLAALVAYRLINARFLPSGFAWHIGLSNSCTLYMTCETWATINLACTLFDDS